MHSREQNFRVSCGKLTRPNGASHRRHRVRLAINILLNQIIVEASYCLYRVVDVGLVAPRIVVNKASTQVSDKCFCKCLMAALTFVSGIASKVNKDVPHDRTSFKVDAREAKSSKLLAALVFSDRKGCGLPCVCETPLSLHQLHLLFMISP